jgi:hypothetical protein
MLEQGDTLGATATVEGGGGSSAVVSGSTAAPYGVNFAMSQVDVTIHPVLKEQLTRFMELTRDPWRERFWALFGAAVAFSPSAGEALYHAYIAEPAVALNILHLVEVILFFATGFGALLIKLFTKPRESAAQALYNQIMSRPTHKVSINS